MRVLEPKPNISIAMVKRKHKLRKQGKEQEPCASDSSDDGAPGATASGRTCPHIGKAVNLNAVKKALRQLGSIGDCTTCARDSNNRKNDVTEMLSACATNGEDDLILETETTIWVCLQCGHQGCDRNSREKHALKHYQTPRSASHAIVVNINTWVIWCYDCDDEIEAHRKLLECVDFVRRLAGLSKADTAVATSGKTSPQLKQEGAGAPEISPESGAVTNDNKSKQQHNRAKASTQAPPTLPKVKGLSNLGNTCFFNAVMQNLNQTPMLESILSERSKKGYTMQVSGCHPDSDGDSSGNEEEREERISVETIDISLPEGGSLTQSLLSFLRDMNCAAKNNVVIPSGLFRQVCRKAPRFKGYQQQDSHELLRHLLDGMKAEEVKRSQAGILKAFHLPEMVNPKKVDEDIKAKIKVYGRQVKHTFVDGLFGGDFISTVVCEECHTPSHIFEPFLDVSVPITEEKPMRPNSLLPRKRETTPTEPAAEPSTKPLNAIDGFAKNGEKGTRHMSKKAKKQARREAKRKGRKTRNKVSPAKSIDEEDQPLEDEGDANCEKEEELLEDEPVSKDQQAACHESSDDMKENGKENTVEGSNSNEEDISDADVEDNIESDVSRNRFQLLDTTDANSLENINENVIADSSINQNDKNTPTERGQLNQEQSTQLMETETKGLSGINAGGDKPSELRQCNHMEGGHSHGDITMGIAEPSSASISGPVTPNSVVNGDTVIDEKELRTEKKTVGNSNACVGCDSRGPGDGISNCQQKDIQQNSSCHGEAPHSPVGQITDAISQLKLNNHAALERTGSKSPTQIVCNGGLECLIDKEDHNLTKPVHAKSAKLTKSKTQLYSEAVLKAMCTLSPRYQPLSHECSVLSCLNQFTAAELLTGNNKFGCGACTKRKHGNQSGKDKKETVYTNASKQLLIFSPPAVLTLHLKRFQQCGFSLRKVNRHVVFPLVLDLAPYCSLLSQGLKQGQTKVLYSLYGVVEHSGRLTAGHYTAYVKVRPQSTANKLKEFQQCMNTKNMSLQRLLQAYQTWDTREETEQVEKAEAEDTSDNPALGRWFYISDSRVSEVTEASVLRCQAYILFYERIN